jgi:hypothetical protein
MAKLKFKLNFGLIETLLIIALMVGLFNMKRGNITPLEFLFQLLVLVSLLLIVNKKSEG